MGHGDTRADGSRSVSAIADMFDAHVHEVYRFVHRRCRDHALAEDITQDVFLTAVRHHDDGDAISIGWLITIAGNRLVDVLRRRANYAGKLRLIAGDGAVDDFDGRVAERLRIEQALDGLRVDHRLVLTLHYIDGLTVAALAERLDRSPKAVEGLLTRARRALRARLEPNETGNRATGDTHGG